LCVLDPQAFGRAFAAFSARFCKARQEVVAIDGKALRRAYRKAM
jgi:hypothetical protein